MLSSRLILFREERASQRRLDTQRGEQTGNGKSRLQSLGVTMACEMVACPNHTITAHLLENVVLFLPVEKVWIGYCVVGELRVSSPYDCQTVWIFVGQWMKQN